MGNIRRFVAVFVLVALLFTNVAPASLAFASDVESAPEEVVEMTSETAPEATEEAAEEVADEEVVEEVADTPETPVEEVTEDVVEETAEAAETPSEEEQAPEEAISAPGLSTDKDDYHPGETVTIWGRFFGAFQNVVLSIVGLNEENETVVTDSWEVEADDAGAFTTFYNLVNEYVPLYLLAANSETGELLTETSFTDSKINVVSIGSQGPNPVTAGNSAAYTVTVSFNGNSISCTANLSVSGLPVGASGVFSPTSVTGSGVVDVNSTLTISTNGALTAGSYPFTVTATRAAGTCQAGDSDSEVGTLVVVTPVVKTDPTLSVTNSPVVYNGLAQAATVAGSVAGTVSDVKYDGSSVVPTDAGTYAVTADFVPNDTTNYNNLNDAAAGMFEIEPAESVTDVVCPDGVTYNGTAQEPCTVTVTGAGDLNLTPDADYTDNTNAGTAEASYTYPGDANHTSSSDTENFVIHKADVTPIITADDKEYDGTGDSTASCDLTGVIGSDDVDCVVGSASFDDANVGTGKTVTATGITLTGADADNYKLTDTTDTDTADITPRDIEVTADAGQSKVFGDSDPAEFTYTVTGGSLVGGDDFTGALSRVAGENVGLYAITQGTLALSSNYNLQFISNDFEITIATSVTTIDCPISVVYNGTAQEPCTATVTGAGGLDESVPVTYGDNTNAGLATAEAAFLGTLNYAPSSDSTTFEIEKADADCTIAGFSGDYDGLAHGATGSCVGVGTDGTLAGLNLGDSFTDVPGGTANWVFTDVSGNYNNQNGSVDIVINKADALCTINGYNGIYDGTAHGATGECRGVQDELLAGLVLGDTFTNVPGGTAFWTFTDETGNYNDDDGSVEIVIEKADAVIVVDPYDVAYDGDPHTSTGSATGVLGEDLSADLDLSGTTHTDAGDYTGDAWTFTDTTGNYNDDAGTVDNRIAQADANVIVEGFTGVYDGLPHGASGTATGVNGEDLSSGLSLGLTFVDVPGGTAFWTFEGGTNYLDENGSAEIVIDPREIEVTADAGQSKVYGDADPAAYTYTITSGTLVDEGDLTGALARDAGETVGLYAITQDSLALTSNYDLTYVSDDFEITKKAASVTPENAQKQYSDPDPDLTGTATGFLPADNVEAAYSREAGENPGTYTISATLSPIEVLGNYDITYNTGTFTIGVETVAIDYTGTEFAMTAGPKITTAPVALSAKLIELDDEPGDLTLAKVTFILTPASGPDITFPNVPVDEDGNALIIKNIPVGDYTISVEISDGNEYWEADPVGAGTLTVALGDNTQRVTGGGWVADVLSANDKDNFGFTVNYNKNGAPKGNFLFMFRGEDGYDYKLKSNSWAKGGLAFNNTNGAFFTAKATLEKIDQDTGEVIESYGNYTFAVDVTDGDLTKPTTKDMFAVTILDGSKKIWKQLGTATSQINLGGGNISVHSK